MLEHVIISEMNRALILGTDEEQNVKGFYEKRPKKASMSVD